MFLQRGLLAWAAYESNMNGLESFGDWQFQVYQCPGQRYAQIKQMADRANRSPGLFVDNYINLNQFVVFGTM